jgi:hypothetical protein
LTNYKCTFSSSQVCKLQNYKLHLLVCKFQIKKFTSQFTKLKILKLQVLVCKYVKLPNYKVTKLQIAIALLHIYKFAHVRFSCFHTYMYYKITYYKHINLQFATIASYKLQINNYNFTILQFYKLQMHVCKFTSLQLCKITNYQITNYKIQNYKVTNCMCTFVNFKFIELKASQFKIIIITKIASTCLQICKLTKLPKLQILQVHFCIFTSKCTWSICMFSDLHVLWNCKIINI